MSDADKEFLADVPRMLRIAYPEKKPTQDIGRDFDVSVHTARGWLYHNAFPIRRKQEFVTKLTSRLDDLDAKAVVIRQQAKVIRQQIIDTMLDGIDPREIDETVL